MFAKENTHPHPHPHANHESSEGFFKGMMIGVLLGAGLLWFFNTESGRRTKKQLQNESNEWLNKARKLVEDLDSEDEMDEEYLASIPSESVPATPAPKKRRFFKRTSK